MAQPAPRATGPLHSSGSNHRWRIVRRRDGRFRACYSETLARQTRLVGCRYRGSVSALCVAAIQRCLSSCSLPGSATPANPTRATSLPGMPTMAQTRTRTMRSRLFFVSSVDIFAALQQTVLISHLGSHLQGSDGTGLPCHTWPDNCHLNRLMKPFLTTSSSYFTTQDNFRQRITRSAKKKCWLCPF